MQALHLSAGALLSAYQFEHFRVRMSTNYVPRHTYTKEKYCSASFLESTNSWSISKQWKLVSLNNEVRITGVAESYLLSRIRIHFIKERGRAASCTWFDLPLILECQSQGNGGIMKLDIFLYY